MAASAVLSTSVPGRRTHIRQGRCRHSCLCDHRHHSRRSRSFHDERHQPRRTLPPPSRCPGRRTSLFQAPARPPGAEHASDARTSVSWSSKRWRCDLPSARLHASARHSSPSVIAARPAARPGRGPRTLQLGARRSRRGSRPGAAPSAADAPPRARRGARRPPWLRLASTRLTGAARGGRSLRTKGWWPDALSQRPQDPLPPNADATRTHITREGAGLAFAQAFAHVRNHRVEHFTDGDKHWHSVAKVPLAGGNDSALASDAAHLAQCELPVPDLLK